MPFPDLILPIALSALLATGISMGVFKLHSSTSSKIRNAHTRFAFSQISEQLNGVEDASLPTTPTELLNMIRVATIDWNSCGIDGDQILDGWGQPIEVTFDEAAGTWKFRSGGKDLVIGTDDDIVTVTTRNQPGEQGADRKPDNVAS